MKQPPLCRIIKAYSTFRVGQEIRPPAMLRGELLRRGYIEIVETNGCAETVAIGTETVADAPPKKKRGRPRRNPGGNE